MALTGNTFGNYKPSSQVLKSFPVEETVHIYSGAMVMINANGYAVPADDTLGSGANCIFAGVALEEADNIRGADGDIDVLVDIGGAEVKATHSAGSMTQANVGDSVFIDSDNAVTSSGLGTSDIAVGVVSEIVSSTVVWVKLRGMGIVS